MQREAKAGVMLPQARSTWGHQELKGRKDLPLEPPDSRLISGSGCHSSKKTRFCCFHPSSSWDFVLVAPGH